MADSPKPHADAHPGEMAFGLLSALVLLVLCLYLAFRAVTDEGRPPDIRVEISRTETVSALHHVEIMARNLGDSTAAEVILRGENAAGEQAEAHYDFLPPGSERRATLVFQTPTQAGEVRLAVVGFAEP